MKLNVDDSIKDNSLCPYFLLKRQHHVFLPFACQTHTHIIHPFMLLRFAHHRTLSRHTLRFIHTEHDQIVQRLAKKRKKSIFMHKHLSTTAVVVSLVFGSQLFAFCLFQIILLPNCLLAVLSSCA